MDKIQWQHFDCKIVGALYQPQNLGQMNMWQKIEQQKLTTEKLYLLGGRGWGRMAMPLFARL